MTPEQVEKRKRIMRRSAALGHCVCDPQKPCPCPVFKKYNVCECAGERLPVGKGPVRLTEHVRGAGCASKIGKKELYEVLKGLPDIADDRVHVGRSAGDDAGVIMLSKNTATVLTVDVFAPSVDDPYSFGQIAAANSVSDIYAMGAEPQVALSVIGFPIHTLPGEVMHEILRGGVEKMKEAGICVIGGHSINDEEVKCGFAVLGTAPKDGCITNSGAEVGDAIVLTKPLGCGIVAFAGQVGRADESSIAAITASMMALNKHAGSLMKKYDAHAATDVTGYSLLGHMSEIVKNSGVKAELDFDAIPKFPGVMDLARQEVLPGAVERNREAVDPKLLDLSGISEAQAHILFSPETSGGLLVFMPPQKAEKYVEKLHSLGVAEATVVGSVSGKVKKGKIVVKSKTASDWTTIKPQKLGKPAPVSVSASPALSCCDDPEAVLDCCAPGDHPAPAVADSPVGTDKKFLAPAAAGDAFKAYMGAVNAPGAIDAKNKKLISLALSVLSKCEPCVKINTEAARQCGASEEEISEAVALGISFGSAALNMFYQQLNK